MQTQAVSKEAPALTSVIGGAERDPKAIKIGTKWLVTKKCTKTRPKVKARSVGREFADDIKAGELFARTLGLPASRYCVSTPNTHHCSATNRVCVAVIDVKSAFTVGLDDQFSLMYQQMTQDVNRKGCLRR